MRFVSPRFAFAKIAGFLALQTSLAALVVLSLWSVFSGTSNNYRSGEGEFEDEDDEPLGEDED